MVYIQTMETRKTAMTKQQKQPRPSRQLGHSQLARDARTNSTARKIFEALVRIQDREKNANQ